MLPTVAKSPAMAGRLGRVVPRIGAAALSGPLLRQPFSLTANESSVAPSRLVASVRPFHSSPGCSQASPSHYPKYSDRHKVLPEFSLRDKVIIVSGGGRGLGLVQAEALLEAGATVHVIDRLPPPTATSDFAKVAARAQDELATSLSYHNVDVRDNVALNDTVAAIAEREGHVDGLIAAAGIQQETPALEYSAEDCDKMMGVNVTGAFMVAQAVAKQMVKRKQKGSLVLIASMSGTIANRGLICPAYNASKAAVLQLSRNLAAEWGQYGIRVNTISPGYIVTAMTATLFDAYPERRTEWPNANMLGRLSYPHEYRGAAVFLLSDASSFMTGADVRMDGGHAAW